jgi:hypothetical protein
MQSTLSPSLLPADIGLQSAQFPSMQLKPVSNFAATQKLWEETTLEFSESKANILLSIIFILTSILQLVTILLPT